MTSGSGVRGPMVPRRDGYGRDTMGMGGARLETTQPHGQSSAQGLIKLHLFDLICIQLHSVLMKHGGRV